MLYPLLSQQTILLNKGKYMKTPNYILLLPFIAALIVGIGFMINPIAHRFGSTVTIVLEVAVSLYTILLYVKSSRLLSSRAKVYLLLTLIVAILGISIAQESL
jgi:hypothetical protein